MGCCHGIQGIKDNIPMVSSSSQASLVAGILRVNSAPAMCHDATLKQRGARKAACVK